MKGRPPGADWRVRAALGIGLACVGLGALVIVGWHTGSVGLTRGLPEFLPMAYAAAVCFILSGAALAVLLSGRLALARLLALLLVLIGSDRVLDGLWGFASVVSLLTGDGAGTLFQRKMGPAGAVAFVLIGLALLDLSRPARRRHPVFLSCVGGVVPGGAVVVILRYLTGDAGTFGGPLADVAVLAAVGLAALGAALLLLTWEGVGEPFVRWTPLLALVGCLTVSLELWYAVVKGQEMAVRSVLEVQASEMTSDLATELRVRGEALDRMANRLASSPDMPETVWRDDALLQREHEGWDTLARLDESLEIVWAVPPGGRVDRAREACAGMAALFTGGPLVGGPVRLGPGSYAVSVCAPVPRRGRAPNFVLGAVRLERLLDLSWGDKIREGAAVDLREGVVDLYRRGEVRDDREATEVRFPLGGTGVHLLVWPSSRQQAARSMFQETALVTGLLFSGLFSLMALGFASARGRAREAEAARRELERLARTLAESEARFRTMSEASPHGVYMFDARGEVVYVNEQHGRITGLDAEQARGWKEFVHPEDRGAVMEHMRRLRQASRVAGGAPLTLAFRFVRPEGSVVWVESKTAPIVRDGAVSGFVGTIEDITKRREAEREVEERARLSAFAADVGAALMRCETLLEALDDAAIALVRHIGVSASSFWMLDQREDALELQACAGFGATLPDGRSRVPVGRFRIGRIARDFKPRVVAIDREPPEEGDRDWALRRGMVFFAGYPLIARGRLMGVMTMFADHHLSKATLAAIVSVADEVALGMDRARAMDALAESEARFRAIYEGSPLGVFLADESGAVQYFNEAYARISGMSADQALGGGWQQAIHPEDRASVMEHVGRVVGSAQVAAGPPASFSFRLVRPDGAVIWVESKTAPIVRAGRVSGFVGIVEDVTERRGIERMKREFVSTVSHELRTPLTSIRGSLGLLDGGALGKLPAEAREMVQIAERNVDRLMALINDLLDLERLDAGRLTLQVRSLPMASVFARSVEAVSGFAEQSGVRLESRPSAARVQADEERLVQVLVNLLSNAVKFSSAGSLVTVAAEERGDLVEVRVTDRGRGIPARFRDAVFERFRQVDASDARREGGTGLGLSICKALVELHGGSIGVESEEGRGSTFWFRIPADRAPEPAPPPGTPAVSEASA